MEDCGGMHGGVENGGGKYRGVVSIGGGKAAWHCPISAYHHQCGARGGRR